MNSPTAAKSRPHVGYLLEQHLEEIAFLNVQRRYLLFAPDVPLDGIRNHDERVAAHWDGLVIGGAASCELALGRLNEFDPWDVYAAVRTWLELGRPPAEEILEQMSAAGSENLAAWREALRRMPAQVLQELLPASATEEAEGEVLAALVFARSWHQIQDPVVLPALGEDPGLESRRTLARVLGWGVVDTETASGILQKLFDDSEPPVVRAALWSAVLLGSSEAVDHCRDNVRDGEADAFQVQVLGLMGQPADGLLLRPLLDDPDLFPAATRALGYLGSVQAVPWLIDKHTEAEDEETDDVVTAGLEILLGELPELEEETLDPWWQRSGSAFSEKSLWLRGRQRPWPLAKEDEPMESLWLASLRSRDPQWSGLQREIPDGFFTAAENIEVLPGE